jgi:GTPase
VATVGYTNAGKTHLVQALTRAELGPCDRPFATLSATSRAMWLGGFKRRCALSDTVGVIRNLPTALVDAFRATLEEARDADLLLVVVDASKPTALTDVRVTFNLLEEVTGLREDALKSRVIEVWNKMDAADEVMVRARTSERLSNGHDVAFASAKTGAGVEALRARIDARLRERLGPRWWGEGEEGEAREEGGDNAS